MSAADKLSLEARSKKFGAAEGEGIVRCDACPILCRIRPGRAGACSRYANEGGHLVRVDPVDPSVDAWVEVIPERDDLLVVRTIEDPDPPSEPRAAAVVQPAPR